MRTQFSKNRVPALLALCLGAALASGCANWGESSRMGAGPSTRGSTTTTTDPATQARPSSGPGTVSPSGTLGPSGSTGSGTGGTGASGAR